MIAMHVIFKGRVQGVGFRYTTRRIADRYQLTGFVRNLPDGTVEMLAQGSSNDIDDCMRNIKEYFSDYIKDAKVNEIPPDPKYTDFQITF
jgi:acylphosphatase